MFKKLYKISGQIEDLYNDLFDLTKTTKKILNDLEELPSDESELDTEKDEN